jgi:hypothetical protein
MYLVKGAHVNRYEVGPETVTAVATAKDGQAKLVLHGPLNASLDMFNFRRPNDLGVIVEPSLGVFDSPSPSALGSVASVSVGRLDDTDSPKNDNEKDDAIEAFVS